MQIKQHGIVDFFSKNQQEGRKHFGCSSLQGVEVENQGGSGTALSYWEKRILEV